MAEVEGFPTIIGDYYPPPLHGDRGFQHSTEPSKVLGDSIDSTNIIRCHLDFAFISVVCWTSTIILQSGQYIKLRNLIFNTVERVPVPSLVYEIGQLSSL